MSEMTPSEKRTRAIKDLRLVAERLTAGELSETVALIHISEAIAVLLEELP